MGKRIQLPPKPEKLTFEQFLAHAEQSGNINLLRRRLRKAFSEHVADAGNIQFGVLPIRHWRNQVIVTVLSSTALFIWLQLSIWGVSGLGLKMLTTLCYLGVLYASIKSYKTLGLSTVPCLIDRTLVRVWADPGATKPPQTFAVTEIDSVLEIKTFDRRQRPEAFSEFFLIIKDRQFSLGEFRATEVDRDLAFLNSSSSE